MEVLSFELDVTRIENYSAELLNEEASLLWIWHADKIPPHIGISTCGHYFSLKSNGKDDGVAIASIVDLLSKKPISTLAIELSSDFTLEETQNAFDTYQTTKNSEITCLHPIRKVLNASDAQKLTDLLSELDERNEIKGIIGFNLKDDFQGIPVYSVQDIHDRLKALENVQE